MPERLDRYLDASSIDMRRRTAHAGLYAAIGQGATVGIGLLSLSVLARLLRPEDFGLIGMAAVFTGLLNVLADGGLTSVTVQRRSLTQAQVSNLFWINGGLGLGLGVVMAASGPALAMVFGRPELVPVSVAMGLSFVLGGASVQHCALLRRALEIGRLNGISIGSAVIGLAVGAWLALEGWGYWSLVMQALASSCARLLLAWALCSWRPSMPSRGSGTRPMLHLGGFLSGATLLTYLYRKGDDLLIGWYWGAAPLGVYSRAYSLLLQPLQQISWPIGQVAVPALSRVQHDPRRFREAYCQGIRLVAWLALPASAVLLVCARPFVLVVLGDRWTDVIEVYRALGPAALLSSITSAATGWAYHALGRGKEAMRWTLFAVPTTLAAFCIALPFGPVAVAAALSTCQVLLAVPQLRNALRDTSVRMADVGRAVAAPCFAAAVASASAGTALAACNSSSAPLAQLLLGGAVFAVGYLSAAILVPQGRKDLRELAAYFRPRTAVEQRAPS
jgi:O-antigen/teichoic acid export membrane protein